MKKKKGASTRGGRRRSSAKDLTPLKSSRIRGGDGTSSTTTATSGKGKVHTSEISVVKVSDATSPL